MNIVEIGSTIINAAKGLRRFFISDLWQLNRGNNNIVNLALAIVLLINHAGCNQRKSGCVPQERPCSTRVSMRLLHRIRRPGGFIPRCTWKASIAPLCARSDATPSLTRNRSSPSHNTSLLNRRKLPARADEECRSWTRM